MDVGANIIATDIDLKNLKKLKVNKKKRKNNIECYKMDVTSEFSINNVLSLLKKKKKNRCSN